MSVSRKIRTSIVKTIGLASGHKVMVINNRPTNSDIVEIQQQYFNDEVHYARRLDSPTFIFCSVRSGSTMLSAMLDAHSRILSPPETHFYSLHASIDAPKTIHRNMAEMGIDDKRAKFLLWDTFLADILDMSDKDLLVEKSPPNVKRWRDIMQCWPDAKIIFLLRHPASMLRSWQERHPDYARDKATNDILKYVKAVNAARDNIKGSTITVRYEDIVSDPEKSMRGVCDFLGVKYEPAMLNFGAKAKPERFRINAGDYSDKVKSGKVQKGRPLPKKSDIPPELLAACKSWGYIK